MVEYEFNAYIDEIEPFQKLPMLLSASCLNLRL